MPRIGDAFADPMAAERRLMEETQPGHDPGNGRCSELALANQIKLVAVNLLAAEEVGRLREILGGGVAKVLASLLDSYPAARTIHLVWDNLNIHCRKSLTDYYGEKQGCEMWSRLTVHPTPKHGSWLNQAEIELSLYSRQCLGTRRIPDLETLERETRSWKARVNRDQVKINWKFDRRAARKKFGYNKNSFKRSIT